MAGHEGKSHPDCINSSNPYHECSDYCYRKIAEAKAKLEEQASLTKPPAERTVHPACINASNPYHECTDYCFKRIADAKDRIGRDAAAGTKVGGAGPSSSREPDDLEGPSQHEQDDDEDGQKTNESDADAVNANKDADAGYPQMTEKQKKLFELRLKMNEARKANQMAMVAEKKKMEAPTESRGISKQKWLEDRKKKIGKLLDSNGLDMKKAYMLDTQEMAETKYKKWEKDPAPQGWDVFNQKTLYNAYKKRTKNIEVDMEAYNKAKEADPEFYREASSLQYGKVGKVQEENIDRMVKELQDTDAKRKAFSRRRKFHEEKDIDSINDRNEHFNKKIERAFGKYTLEIKNNLERGTALPD
ncbi:Pre-mRNA-splicing factor syf2 [Rhynchospora pubera]|uniref:Pre-mRNA-splicing factor SYF2 n=1 Tax=Rhynchospora pubera TaxID=906938 RepID=A0AAV8GL35_9POAL|nr:Pre-mRNA-splicing factor syf2 [Rhynchospora pubera]KAJ4804012.1 Pre-mRNA-splicing factor syf2 [Rhynchospora pubera]